MASDLSAKQQEWNHDSLDLDLFDETFDGINYLHNYDDNNLQTLTDLDLSLLLSETPPDIPDDESQTSNPSDNISDSGNSSNHSSPSSPSSSNSGSCNEFINSRLNFSYQQPNIQSFPATVSNSHYLPQPSTLLHQQSPLIVPQSNGQQIVFTNGFTNYSTYQPYVQAIPVVQAPPTIQNTIKQSSFRPIACKPTITHSQISSPSPPSSTSSTSSLHQHGTYDNENEALKKLKIEERKKKNRIASTNSRMKQKDHLIKLENNVKELSKERDFLKNENKKLKLRIKELEDLLGFKTTNPKSDVDLNGNYINKSKAKLSMFAVLCFLCFQVSPYFTINQVSQTNLQSNSDSLNTTAIQLSTNIPQFSIHHGRHLLWAMNNSDDDSLNNKNKQNSVKNYEESFHKLQNKFNHSLPEIAYRNSSIKCSDYFNVTESIRLENELRDLLTKLKFEDLQRERIRYDFKNLRNKKQKNKKLLFDSKHVPIPKLKSWMQKQKYGSEYIDDEQFSDNTNDNNNNNNNNNHKKSKQNDELFDYETLLSNVHRRDDTFYYLSYPSKGHLFLPPVSNRTDIRPRFSFLIPSYGNLTLDDSFNDTKNNNSRQLSNSSNSQMVLLQIDCQVINTKVILINSDNVLKQSKYKNYKKYFHSSFNSNSYHNSRINDSIRNSFDNSNNSSSNTDK